MTPLELARELRERGLAILAVVPDENAPEILMVYLHGNAGQWVDGAALCSIAQVPEVVTVTESEQTPSIMIVRIQPAGRR